MEVGGWKPRNGNQVNKVVQEPEGGEGGSEGICIKGIGCYANGTTWGSMGMNTHSEPSNVSMEDTGGGVSAAGTSQSSFWAHPPPMTIFDSVPTLPHPISTSNNPHIEWLP